MLRLTSCLLVIVVLVLGLVQRGSAYELLDLGDVTPTDINNNGQIVGWFPSPSGENHAFLLDAKIGFDLVDLGPGWASAINDAGQVVGAQTIGTNNQAVFFDTSGGGANLPLGTLEGTGSSADAINDLGEVVGRAEVGYGPHATLFDTTGGGANTDLNTLGGLSLALGINNNGQIVGTANYFSGSEAAVIFDPSGGVAPIILSDVGGNPNGSGGAKAINNSDQIVGWSRNTSDEIVATLFDLSGEVHALSNFYSIASGNNENGQIVGFFKQDPSGPQFATLFDSTGNGANLILEEVINPDLGWTLDRAFDINNDGWIVGRGQDHGMVRGYLLIPEPSTFVLLSMGIIGFLAYAWRRRRK